MTFIFGCCIFIRLALSESLFLICLEQFLLGHSRRTSAIPTDVGAAKEEEEWVQKLTPFLTKLELLIFVREISSRFLHCVLGCCLTAVSHFSFPEYCSKIERTFKSIFLTRDYKSAFGPSGPSGRRLHASPVSVAWSDWEYFYCHLDGMPVHRRVTPSIKLAGTHLYTWVERGTVRVECFAQEQNTMSPARARTRTARSRDERTINHEAIAPSYTRLWNCLNSDIPKCCLKDKFINCSSQCVITFMLIASLKSEYP